MERGAVAHAAGLLLLTLFSFFTLAGCKQDTNMQSRLNRPLQGDPDTNTRYSATGDSTAASGLTLFLCGDVMTGRGIDQVLPFSVKPRLYEAYVKDARDYVKLAEKKHGSIERPVDYSYIWGDALLVWEQERPDLKLINLETSITTAAEPWPDKEVQYRMHPGNVAVLSAAGIDAASLANNHTLDWGRSGLLETIQTLQKANITVVGAGLTREEAQKPAILGTPKGRVIVLAFGAASSGVYPEWAATPTQAGVNLLPDLGEETVQGIAAQVKPLKTPGDVVVFSVHWGGNWGYDVPPAHRDFARKLIDSAGVDLVFGHSSHHPMGLEVYRNKLIVYGAGDFINDYEGISGHEQYRDDLTLMYFPQLDKKTGNLISLKMVPMQLQKFRLHYASGEDAAWLAEVLNRESMKFGTAVGQRDGSLILEK